MLPSEVHVPIIPKLAPMRPAALFFAVLVTVGLASPRAYAQTPQTRWNAAFTHFNGNRATGDVGGVLLLAIHRDGVVTGHFVGEHSRPPSLLGRTTSTVKGERRGLNLSFDVIGSGHLLARVNARFLTDQQLHGTADIGNVRYVFSANEL
jgi:hypothetical protein